MTEPLDFSKTERIVLLIDLHPLFCLENPNPYLTATVASVTRLLNFPPLFKSLLAYKLFFSSLSPLRSASAVHRLLPNSSLTSLSFNDPSHTLASLSTALNSLSQSPIATELSNARPLASHTAASLLQLVHDYAWESELETVVGKGNQHFPLVRSNLVLLFSSVCCSISSLSDYLDVGVGSRVLCELDEFSVNFCHLFGAVHDAFAGRDIHLSWINVKYESQGNYNEVKENIFGKELGLFDEGIRNLGWGFCSTDSIILGSAILPFRLIYPKIGVSLNFANSSWSCKRSDVQLYLEIFDVNGKPLECNCCHLELLNLKTLSGKKSDDSWGSLELRDSQSEKLDSREAFWHRFGDGMIKLSFKAVQKYNEEEKIEGCLSDCILVKELSRESKKQKRNSTDDFFADRVLDILSREINEACSCNTMPIWQILLSFLSGEGYLALVSLSNKNGDTILGVLKPFTAHSALLSVVDSDFLGDHCRSVSNLGRGRCETYNSYTDISNSNGFIGSQIETSTSGDCDPFGGGKMKKHKKHLHQDLTWSSFCKAASECSDFDLAAIYFSRKFDKPKKLKFLKCWLKQIGNHSQNYVKSFHVSNSTEESTPSLSFSSEQSGKQEEAVISSCPETSEAFFGSLKKRIQQGLESGMHLQTLAERLVKSSIYWLLRSYKTYENAEGQNPIQLDGSCQSLGAKLIDLLLTDPKEMNDMRNCSNPSSNSCDPNPASDLTVRKYELQVLLRMEIFRSDISVNKEQPLKQKLLKQICSLLDIIQYLIDGGIHGNVSLYEYVERTIKMRYCNVLDDIVKDLYTQMDLLPFGDEDETQALLFNSEDSGQSWRDNKDTYEKAESHDVYQSVSVEEETYQQQENVDESPEGIRKDEQARKLSEARERRERARRFVSFTSWMPDLQRVWAPKPLKAMNGRSDSMNKDSKRKDKERAGHSVVCETPMTEAKRPCSRNTSEGDDECKDPENYSSSVSKALFQDD
ncbi:uncharacterized protein LOC113763171 [Coffea eugenioides]|uniref:uncharacterized protein LOC113763171 n=1 Tax=Coffea eugenioides TaxID=49369 RepID=UPI000F6111F8|nr:uncharacterized protein LOC113763171 [Coffea eugenioides]